MPKQADGFILAVETKTKSRNRMMRDRYIYVLDRNGRPLMPCRWSRARKLLRDGKAVVVRKDIYTIRLTVPSSGYRKVVLVSRQRGGFIIEKVDKNNARSLFENKGIFADNHINE